MTFYIKNISSGFVLDVKNEGKGSCPEVMLYSFHGGDNQIWEYKDHMIISKSNGLALDICGGTQGGSIITQQRHGGANQKWHFDDDSTIRSETGMVLDVKNGAKEKCAQLIGNTKHGGPSQKFQIVPHK